MQDYQKYKLYWERRILGHIKKKTIIFNRPLLKRVRFQGIFLENIK